MNPKGTSMENWLKKKKIKKLEHNDTSLEWIVQMKTYYNSLINYLTLLKQLALEFIFERIQPKI